MAKQNRKQARRRLPVSTHRLFPAFVTIWFAALLGLSCLALNPSLLDRLMLASGIDAAIRTVALPLGMSGRIVLAVLMALAGAVIGALVARLARPSWAKYAPAHSADAPIAAAFEPLPLAGYEIAVEDAPAEPAASRRRPLTLESHDEPAAPLPVLPATARLHDLMAQARASGQPPLSEADMTSVPAQDEVLDSQWQEEERPEDDHGRPVKPHRSSAQVFKPATKPS